MYALVITDGPGQGRRLLLTGKVDFTIGKNTGCDLVIADPRIADFQAVLVILPAGTVQLKNCHSQIPAYVNNRQVGDAALLNPGDAITLGGSIMTLFNVGSQENPVMQSAPVISEPSAKTNYEPATAVKRTMDFATPAVLTIGRDPANDIVLDHPLVSRRHAKITFVNGRYLITDLHSMNGTFLEGTLVQKPTPLPPNALIAVGGYRLYFNNGHLVEYDDADGVRVEIQHLRRQITTRAKTVKLLLDDITLTIEPREFVAILGGSGAGKSTLLGALTGIAKADSGSVLINGLDINEDYGMIKSMIGYVPQDDIIHHELTVDEVLTYAAKLRMPDDYDAAQLRRQIDGVIQDLELTHHTHTYVRELSGGQRKRVSIGVEMLTQPSLFFLDEPTSGLDPGLEKVMMELLRKLAKEGKGRTIILVTHATCNISLCDKVVFLARGGQLAFYGTPAQALTYFQCDDFAEIYKKIDTTKTPQEWAKLFAASGMTQQSPADRRLTPAIKPAREPAAKTAQNSAFKQWWILTARYIKIMGRDRKNLLFLLAQGFIIPAIIISVFHYAAPAFAPSQYTAGELTVTPAVMAAGKLSATAQHAADESKRLSGMIQTISMMLYTAILLGASNSAREIVKEQAILRRERLANLQLQPYLLSKIAVLSIICLAQSLMLLGIVKYGLGLPNFCLNLAAFWLTSVASMMMGLALSACVANTDKAGTMVILLLIPQIILSGAIIPISDVKPVWMQGVYNLAISKWSFSLISGGIVNVRSLICPDVGQGSIVTDIYAVSSAANWTALLVFVGIMYILATLALRRKAAVSER